MSNVLGTLFKDIADSIRAKTGDTATMKPAEFPIKIAAIETGGGSGVGVQTTEYLPETTFTNEYIPEIGAFARVIPIGQATMEAWMANSEPVTVVYDGEEYELTPQVITGADGNDGVCVGNLAAFGGTGNNEPFAVVSWIVDEIPCLLIGSTVDMAPTTHTVRIYQEVSSDGEWAIAEGDVDGNGDVLTVTHGLGVIPDIITVLYNNSGRPLPSGTESAGCLVTGCFFGEKMLGEAATTTRGYGYIFAYSPSNQTTVIATPTDGIENAWLGIRDVNAQTFQLGTSAIKLFSTETYTWRAYARK